MSFDETTNPLMSPTQVEDALEEKQRLERMISPQTPGYIRSQVQDRGEVMRQLRSLDRMIETQAPKPYSSTDIDKARAKEKELLDKITTGMPSQAEMRKNPPGAVDRHRSWEEANKSDIIKWRNIRKRLLASGCDEYGGPRSVANLERYRPVQSQLNMDNAQIPGKNIHIPRNVEIKNVMSDEEREEMRREIEELKARLAGPAEEAPEKPKQKRKRNLSPEAREAARQRMRQYWAKKRAAEAAGGS